MSAWEDCRLLALRDVLQGGAEYQHRRVLRWYSRTFRTPLHDVEQLPLEYVLQHYYETFWEQSEPEELEEARLHALKTDDERWDDQMREEGGNILDDEAVVRAEKLLLDLKARKAGGNLSPGTAPRAGDKPGAPKRRDVTDPKWNPELTTGAVKRPEPKPFPSLPTLKLDLQDLEGPAFESAGDEMSPLDRDSGANLVGVGKPAKRRP